MPCCGATPIGRSRLLSSVPRGMSRKLRRRSRWVPSSTYRNRPTSRPSPTPSAGCCSNGLVLRTARPIGPQPNGLRRFPPSSCSVFMDLSLLARLSGPLVPKIRVERRPAMSQKPIEQQGIVQPMIDELTKSNKTSNPAESATPPKQGPLAPAELDQDAGGGYNPDHTYPQA